MRHIVAAMPASTPAQIESAYQAAQMVVETHRRVSKFLRIGMKLPEIDAFVAHTLDQLNCKSCFLHYTPNRRLHNPFPSHACLSVNECVVHGTAAYYDKPLQQGDLLKVDIGVFHTRAGGVGKWVGDAAWTYCFGEPTPIVRALMDSGKESLRLGIEQIRPTNTWLAFAQAVQQRVEKDAPFHLVRGLGGHGIGDNMLHGPPFVSNTAPSYPGEWPEAFQKCKVGEIVAVEPMIAIGTGKTKSVGKEWPVFTADGSLSVHYEHDVLVTESGPRVLTEGLEGIEDVICR